MALDIEKEIKIYWILGIIVLIIYGLWLFISVESYVVVMNYPYFDPIAGRLVGALFITWAIIMVKLFKEIDEWEKIENWILFSIISNILFVIADIIVIIAYNIPLGSLIIGNILNIFFVIVGIHIWIQKRK